MRTLILFGMLTSLCACSVTRNITFNTLSDEAVRRMEAEHYPMTQATYRIRNGMSKDKVAAQYLNEVSFVNIYDPEGQLVASTGTGACEFKVLTAFKDGITRPDSTQTIQSLLELLEPACKQPPIDLHRKATIVVGSAQFLDQVPFYRARRKRLAEQLRQFPEATTAIWIVNFDLRPDSVSKADIR